MNMQLWALMGSFYSRHFINQKIPTMNNESARNAGETFHLLEDLHPTGPGKQ